MISHISNLINLDFSVPHHLLRLLAANGGLNSGIHIPTPAEQNPIWPATTTVASASTSGNNDLARGNVSVDTNGIYPFVLPNVNNYISVDNNFVDPVGIECSETSSSTSSANAQVGTNLRIFVSPS